MDPSVPQPDWPPARSTELEPPRRSISKVSNETFESKLDELDRLFAEEAQPTRGRGPAPLELEDELEAFAPDEQLVDPGEFRESLIVPPAPPPAPTARARGRRDSLIRWPAPVPPVDEPGQLPASLPPDPAPPVARAMPPWPPAPERTPASPVPPPAAAVAQPPTPVRLDVPQSTQAEARAADAPLVAGLRSKQDIVNAFKNLLAAERSEAEAKARLIPGGDSRMAEIVLPKSINPTTLKLKLEPRTDAEGRTVLSITVE